MALPISVAQAGPERLPGDYELGKDPPPSEAVSPLDSAEALAELCTCEDWYSEATDALGECFAEMATDHDYYDSLQWTDEDKAELMARGQGALVYNKAALVVDWLTGTERRTRIDFAVHPKTKAASEQAKVKEKLLKYQSDVNYIGWNRSRAFKDATIGGLGWTEASIRGDLEQELVLHAWVPWQQIKWDPFSRALDLDDCRYIHRRRWVDLDYAIAMAPEREAVLRRAARTHVFGDEEWGQDQLDLPQVWRRYDSRGAEIVQRRWTGAAPIVGSTHRQRVPLTETWFRKPVRTKKIYGLDWRGDRYDADNAEMLSAVQGGYASITDALVQEIHCCIWVPGGVIWRGPSPFRHGSFPYTPIWYKRRNRDGTPYGAIRTIRDAQDDFNKRFSKAQWLLSVNQLLYEESAIDADRKAEVQRNLAKPSGMVEFKNGALSGNKIKLERNVELADAQLKMLDIAAAHIHDGSGVNRELLGRDTNATSGRAIRAKQDEGSVTTAELFDNERLMVQIEGKKLLSLNEQFMTLPMQFLIAGGTDTRMADWLEINQPEMAEDGTWRIKNDITQADAVFVVDQVDFRETVRQAQAEQFGDMLKNLPPEAQMALLDIFIEMTDIPNRDEAVKRVRAITGHGNDSQPHDPAVEAERQRREQAAQQEQELQLRERLAQVGLTEAKAQEVMAKARKVSVEGKGNALNLAELIEALLPLAPAADRLYVTPEETRVPDQPQPQPQ